MKIKFILCDIEGTTSSIDFVHKILFPYSLNKLEEYLNQNYANENIQKLVQETLQLKHQISHINEISHLLERSSLTQTDFIEVLKKLIQNDIKFGPLKSLQGLIWQHGYESGEIKGHVYPDVESTFKHWVNQLHLKIGIYSSGSVLAQKLIFGFTEYGNLNQYLSAYFDTQVGGKQEVSSYLIISKELDISADQILFLSDRVEELIAAHQAGLNVRLLNRERELQINVNFEQVYSFDEIKII